MRCERETCLFNEGESCVHPAPWIDVYGRCTCFYLSPEKGGFDYGVALPALRARVARGQKKGSGRDGSR